MLAYNGQRLGAATVALGLAQGEYERALANASERKQFGRPIADFQGLRWKLVDMAVKIDLSRRRYSASVRSIFTRVDNMRPMASARRLSGACVMMASASAVGSRGGTR